MRHHKTGRKFNRPKNQRTALVRSLARSLIIHERIATTEANAAPEYKQGIVDGRAADIVYSSLFTGVHGNYLRKSIELAGMDPDNLPEGDIKTMDFGTGDGSKAKAWKDIWGSGQGIGAIDAVRPAGEYVARLIAEYAEAKAALCR